MSDDERRQRDWLDAELDRMALGGSPGQPTYASEAERALSDTARVMHRLDGEQTGQPDPQFLRNLEKQLMPSTEMPASWSGPPPGSAKQLITHVESRFRQERTAHRWTTTLAYVSSFALIVAIVAAAISVTYWDRSPGGSEPGNFAAVGEGSTPDAAGATPSTGLSDDIAWSLPFPEGMQSASTGQLIVENGLVYRQITLQTGNEGTNFNGVQAIDSLTGEISWQVPTSWTRTGFEADENGLYFVAEPNRVVAVTPDTGDEFWSLSFTGSIVSMALRDGTLYVWDTTNTMSTVDTITGDTGWETPSELDGQFQMTGDGMPISNAQVAVGETAVAAIAADGTLVAFDRKNGEMTWTKPGFDALTSATVVTDDTLFVLSNPDSALENEPFPDREGVGINLVDGTELWSIIISGPVLNPVAPGGTEQFHFVANSVTTVESDAPASTPTIDGESPGGFWPETTPSNQYGEQGFEGAEYVFGLDAQTGQVRWQRSSNAGGFATVGISNSSSEGLWAVTYDGFVVHLAGEYGGLLGSPVLIPDPIKMITAGSAEEGVVVWTLGGTIYAFGQVPFSQQG